MIFVLDTSTPEARYWLYDTAASCVGYATWEAGRDLSVGLLAHLNEFLSQYQQDFGSLSGIVVYKGPGSFTGLRIGVTVANTIAYDRHIPIVGETGDSWIDQGLARLSSGENDSLVLPFYGAEANISLPKK